MDSCEERFQFSNQQCLKCRKAKKCYEKTKEILKDEEQQFMTIPYVLLKDKKLSSETKMVGATIYCDAKRNLLEESEEKTKTIKTSKLTYSKIKDYWNKDVSDKTIYKHLKILEKYNHIKRVKTGIQIRGWKKKNELVIDSIIFTDSNISDTEAICIAGYLGFDKTPLEWLSKRLTLSIRTIERAKKKFKLERFV